LRFTNQPPLQCGRDGIMAVAKNICFDDDVFADRPLDGESPAVDLRLQPFDDNPLSAVFIAHAIGHLLPGPVMRVSI
jgi:hypothetical protein